MKILHSAYMLNPISGIIRQMSQERSSAHKVGLPFETKIFCSGNESDPIFVRHNASKNNWFTHRVAYYKWLNKATFDADALLLRYISTDPLQYAFVKRCQIPVFTVHHTKEVFEEQSKHSYRGYLKAVCESVLGRLTISNCKGIIGVTPEIAEWEKMRSRNFHIPIAIYPNAAPDAAFSPRDERGKTCEILFVASQFSAPWQGLDLLLNSLNNCSENFILHLIGNASDQMVRDITHDSRVIFHGPLSGFEIAQISAKCTVGISGLAQNRRGLSQACTLKVREYLALGIPSYASYEEVFPHDFRYFRNGPPNIASILEYAKEMRAVSRTSVITLAKPFIDKNQILSNLYLALKTILS